jgi:hypothetical protein
VATAVHIPISELSAEMKDLVERARVGEEVVFDVDGVRLQLVRRFARTAEEVLADPSIRWSDVVPDEEFANDLEAIVAERKLPERDPWAE